jgi:hypothetical protein
MPILWLLTKKRIFIMNKIFNLTRRQWLIAFLSVAIFIPSLEAAPQRCERLEHEHLPILSTRLNPKVIANKVREEQANNKKYTESKAKGVVGEKQARDRVETSSRMRRVSLFTYFENMGCDIKSYIRGKGDQGLDDIFVTLDGNGRINRKVGPIFHEAKYNGRCQLLLNHTATICDQLSTPWIQHNLKTTTVEFQFPDNNDIKVRSCSKCNQQFLRDIEWIKKQFETGNFNRTASVLCANGNLKFYEITSKK